MNELLFNNLHVTMYLPNRNPLQIQTPTLSHEQLVDHLVRVDKNAIKLTGIQSLHAVFKSSITYPISNTTKARYEVTAFIPLNDPMFQSDELIFYVYPSKAAPYVRFNFERYTNNSGIGI